MKTLTEIKKVQTLEDLENLGIGNVFCDLSYRGGGLGFYASDIANHFKVYEWELPRKFGAGCNYLGGGLRGAIFASSFASTITGKKAKLLTELADACKRVYNNLEDESGLNDEQDEEGNTNWEATGTNASRRAGIESAY